MTIYQVTGGICCGQSGACYHAYVVRRVPVAVGTQRNTRRTQLIDHLKKAEMAKEAERLLDGTGWLPEPLRLAGAEPAVTEPADEAEALPDFLAADEDGAGTADSEEPEPHAIAAE